MSVCAIPPVRDIAMSSLYPSSAYCMVNLSTSRERLLLLLLLLMMTIKSKYFDMTVLL